MKALVCGRHCIACFSSILPKTPSEKRVLMTSNSILKTVAIRIVLNIVVMIIMALVWKTIQTGMEDVDLSSKFAPKKGSNDTGAMIRLNDPQFSMHKIGGYGNVKETLRRNVVVPLMHTQVFYSKIGSVLRPPSGVLLSGPPGTGKTMLAKACAFESKAGFLALHAATLESKWWGETPKLLQAAFDTARKQAPCIIFFDEIDSLGRSRSELDQSSVYSLKCELLRNFDTVSTQDEAVVVMACTNCPQSLDAALKRRFTCSIPITYPEKEERIDILKRLHANELSVDAELLHAVADVSHGFSGADLRSAFEEATRHRVWERGDIEAQLSMDDSLTATKVLQQLGGITIEDWLAVAKLSTRPLADAYASLSPTKQEEDDDDDHE